MVKPWQCCVLDLVHLVWRNSHFSALPSWKGGRSNSSIVSVKVLSLQPPGDLTKAVSGQGLDVGGFGLLLKAFTKERNLLVI